MSYELKIMQLPLEEQVQQTSQNSKHKLPSIVKKWNGLTWTK